VTLVNQGTAGLANVTNNLVNGATLRNEGMLAVGDGANVQGNGSIANAAGATLKPNPGLVSATIAVALANAGTVDLVSGTLNFNQFEQTAGSTILDGGNLAGVVIIQGGALTGAGTVYGSVTNAGQVSPGLPVGTIADQGSYTQSPGGDLLIDLGGTAAGQFDQLASGGPVTLGGALDLTLTNGFVPHQGDQFTIIDNRGSLPINGTFANLSEGATISVSGYQFQISYGGGTDHQDVTLTVTQVPAAQASLSGIVWEDFNDDGQVDFGEKGIDGVTITLTGKDDLGNAVNLSQVTDSGGAYVFLNLRPGNYYLTETQPAGYSQGIDSIGTAGGSLIATDQFFVQLGAGVNGLNYNFGEQPPGGGAVQKGQTAGIGFWNNKNGQALIKALPVVTNADGSVTSVANWLAATLPNMFGAGAGSNDLAGKSNAAVAALFQSDFLLKGVKLDAQVLATALSVYATNTTLDSTQVAAQYGFTVSGNGAGTATVNVGSNGDAFGVANNTTMTLMDLLLATDAQAVNGLLYNGNTTRRNEANTVYSAVNQAGGI
jgi:hypothetical protein